MMNLKVKYDVIIIGNGIASKVFQFHFLKSNPNKKLLVLESPLYPSCSIKTTSHVGLERPIRGVSPLGDLIVDSFDSFKDFVENYEPVGIEKGHSYQDDLTNGSEHFFINPIRLLDWLDQKTSGPNRELIKAHIDKIYENQNNTVAASASQEFESTQLVIANGGQFNKLNLMDNVQFSHNGFVQRPGSFWRCPVNIPLKDESFLFTKGKANLVYRKSEEHVLIGGTTQDDEEFGIDFKTLHDWYKIFKQDIPNLPDFGSGNVDMGIRFRGPKRFPLIDKVKGYSKVFGLIGLHKNGFSYPFWGSMYLLNKMDLFKN